MALFLFFIIYPLCTEIMYSFFDKKQGVEPVFAGLKNFIRLWETSVYRHTLWNTIVLWTGIAVNIKLLFALILANYLAKATKTRRVIRLVLLVPWALPLVPGLVTWRWIWDTDWGVVNRALQTYFDYSPTPFFADYSYAMALIILFHVWKWTPFWTLILVGGMQSIPTSIYESADLDGAGRWETFKNITWPLIKPLYVICLLLSIVWSLGEFTTVWVLTWGAPGESTHLVATLAYRYGFVYGDLGIAYACFVFMLPMVLGMIFLLINRIEKISK